MQVVAFFHFAEGIGYRMSSSWPQLSHTSGFGFTALRLVPFLTSRVALFLAPPTGLFCEYWEHKTDMGTKH